MVRYQIAEREVGEGPQNLATSRPSGESATDLRFRLLLGEAAWARLPAAVQARFSKRLGPNAVALYRGAVVETRLSRMGWLLAQCLRPMGAPLPLRSERGGAALVCVSEDTKTGGQCWSRLYASAHGLPQVIHSAKAFTGPTGLEERVGMGIGMALNVEACADGMTFTSAEYFWQIGRVRLRLPKWMAPGRTTVIHRDIGAGHFAFDLIVRHPLFGELVHQHALFQDL
ncbi:MAG: DUF4166 domain-containing protein [Pseudomonadota bacterium]